MLRRSLRRLTTERWIFGISRATQPYCKGDMLPRLENEAYTTQTSGASAAQTGNPSLPLYDTETMFNVVETTDLERKQYNLFKGVSNYKIEPVGEGEEITTLAIIARMESEKKLDELFWGRLLKDFPSLKKPFTADLKAEFLQFYKSAIAVVHDEKAVTELGQPFIAKQWETNYINPQTFWRISEKLADSLDSFQSEHNRYEKRAARAVVERVTKITHNSLNNLKWVHNEVTDPNFMNMTSLRAWHEAGFW